MAHGGTPSPRHFVLMKTKLLLLLLTLLAATLPSLASDFTVNGLYYTFTSDGQAVTVSGGSGTTISIPDNVTYIGKQYPVIAIDAKAFYNQDINYITIGKNVKTIGNEAFYRNSKSNLTQIVFNEGLEVIGERAFSFYYNNYDNYVLKSITIPASVKVIKNGAFAGHDNLEKITFAGYNIEDIGADVFSGTKWLSNQQGLYYAGNAVLGYKGSMPNNTPIEIKEGTTVIGRYAFEGRNQISSINIPSSLKIILGNAFHNCSGLTSVTIGNSVTSIGSYAFYGCSGLTSVTIPNSVTSIGGYAFYNCSGLTSVTIPNTITSIEEGLFRGCRNLKSISIPNSVTSIGNSAFSGCTGLTSLSLSNSLQSIANDAFSNCSNVITLTFNASQLTDYTAMNQLTGVETLNFGNNLTSIPSSLVKGFANLKNVSLGAKITAIEDNAFMGLTKLESIDLKSVKTIGNNAFKGCSSITSISLPNTVTSIGEFTFSGCTNLSEATLSTGMTNIKRGVFSECKSLTKFSIPSNIKSVGPQAFAGCSGLETVVIPANATTIADSTFLGCIAMRTLALPTTITNIGVRAFYNCVNLTNVTIPNSVNVISELAFAGCAGLTDLTWNAVNCATNGNMSTSNIERVTIGESVKILPENFLLGSKITSVTIPSSVTTIEAAAFRSCTNLTKVVLPNSVKALPNYMLSGCSALSSITLGNAVESFGDYALANCISLKSLSIPSTTKNIANNAFSGCTGLTSSVTIPSKVATLGTNAFSGCTGVTMLNYRAAALDNPQNLSGLSNVNVVNFDGGATVVPANLLPNFSKLATVYVGKDVTTIQSGAFSNCNVLKTLSYDAANCASGELSIASLDTLTIGPNVKSLAGRAFYNCTNLKKMVSKATTPPTLGGDDVFPWNTYIGVPASAGVTYKNKWAKIANDSYTRVLPMPIYRFDIKAEFLENGKPFVKTDAISESKASCSETGFIIVNMTNYNKRKVKSTYMSIGNNKVYFSNTELSKYVLPGHTYWIYPYIVSGSVEYDGYYYAVLEIPALQSAYNSNVGPSSIILTDNTVIPENINFTNATFTLDNKTYESYGNDIIVTGLKPNNWYSGNYSVAVSEGAINSTSVGFSTPSLSMKTQPVKMLTNTVAMFQAYTNLNEEETSCGFLWKRYDAPDEMLGNPVYCPVYDGMMMGSLKNMPEGVYYKYRPFYRANDGTQYYGDWVAFYTGDATVEFEPVAHTYNNARVSGDNAIIQGIAIRGSKDITEQGFEYWTNGPVQSEALMAPSSVNKVAATGERMSSTLENLKGGTNYSFRAYVKTANGTTYGEVRSFKTPKTSASGDVNGDNKVDVEDVNAVINIILELKDASNYPGNADLNGDNKVDVEDVNAVINIILGL